MCDVWWFVEIVCGSGNDKLVLLLFNTALFVVLVIAAFIGTGMQDGSSVFNSSVKADFYEYKFICAWYVFDKHMYMWRNQIMKLWCTYVYSRRYFQQILPLINHFFIFFVCYILMQLKFRWFSLIKQKMRQQTQFLFG